MPTAVWMALLHRMRNYSHQLKCRKCSAFFAQTKWVTHIFTPHSLTPFSYTSSRTHQAHDADGYDVVDLTSSAFVLWSNAESMAVTVEKFCENYRPRHCPLETVVSPQRHRNRARETRRQGAREKATNGFRRCCGKVFACDDATTRRSAHACIKAIVPMPTFATFGKCDIWFVRVRRCDEVASRHDTRVRRLHSVFGCSAVLVSRQAPEHSGSTKEFRVRKSKARCAVERCCQR